MHITNTLLRLIARFGYIARGLVYLVVGAIAINAAIDLEQAKDVHGAMRTIVQQQFGVPVLLGVGLGMAAYSVWRFAQSLFDVDSHGFGVRGSGVRLGMLVSALLHLGLGYEAVKIALSIGSSQGTPVRAEVAYVFALPLGQWLVAGGAICIGIAGFAQLYKGATAGFRRWFQASDAAMLWIDPIGRFGLCARGLLFVVISVFVAYAAITFVPGKAVGLQGALLWIQALTFGRWLLGACGIGLFAFGVYSVIEAFVRRVGVGNRCTA